MVLTAHFIDFDWSLHKRILSFCPIENHKGDTIRKTVERNLKDWGIEREITLTVDNASSNDIAIAYLLRRFNKGLLFGGEFLHVRCCAHILNLIVCDAFKEHNDCINRIRYVVRFIRSSSTRFLKFKKCIEIEKISCKSFVCLEVPTRWNSTYLMLEAVVKFEKAFDRLEDEDASYRHDLSPNKEDWKNAKMLISANAMLVGMANSTRPNLRKVAKSMENVVEQCCRRLFHEYSNQSGSGSTTTINTPIVSASETIIDCDPTEKVGEDFVYDTIGIDFEGDETTPFKQGSEIDIYLLEANVKNEGDFNILQWWKMNSHQFEVPSRMARDILAIPISTVAYKLVFSSGGRVFDSSHCSLAPKTVEALICTQIWLHSGPIDLEVQHDLEEASFFEEGFRAVMDNEKEIQGLIDFAKLSLID
ncbi:zinc finger BED domain-containing protein RICESLEEPER 2-like [Benincasa hispida]|uniref:zinc finger BED domain-containing protein RICESLEEPER 2-like n=1 Tax=Benincasa hispida TaxID=102211 RepID=UPI0019012889|nr:zinc finger BED domain-containing protein RICESLEEPER 2-like [Benincasa hispida]